MLRDVAANDPAWCLGILRYFNPVGTPDSGPIGENPLGNPSNLMPLITKVADERKEQLCVFGNEFDTRDGTGVRDLIHVTDLVAGHLRAHEVLAFGSAPSNCFTVNLGAGSGYGVLEMVRAFERAFNKEVR